MLEPPIDTWPVMLGRQAFSNFALSARYHQHYFRTQDDEQFLADVLATSITRKAEFAPSKKLWRAQRGSVWQEEVVIARDDEGHEYFSLGERPLPSCRMKPKERNWAPRVAQTLRNFLPLSSDQPKHCSCRSATVARCKRLHRRVCYRSRCHADRLLEIL